MTILVVSVVVLFSISVKEGLGPVAYDKKSLNLIPENAGINSRCMFPYVNEAALDALTGYTLNNPSDPNTNQIISEIVSTINNYTYNATNPNPIGDFQNSCIVQPFQKYMKTYPDKNQNILSLETAVLNAMLDAYNQNLNTCSTITPTVSPTPTPSPTPASAILSGKESTTLGASVLNQTKPIAPLPADVLQQLMSGK